MSRESVGRGRHDVTTNELQLKCHVKSGIIYIEWEKEWRQKGLDQNDSFIYFKASRLNIQFPFPLLILSLIHIL